MSNNQEIRGELFITMWERSVDQHDRYKIAEISVGMRPASERRRYNVKTPLICWAHTKTDPLDSEDIIVVKLGLNYFFLSINVLKGLDYHLFSFIRNDSTATVLEVQMNSV